MDRKLASIQRVTEVSPIKDADFIERIKVMGWTLVAKKGDFAVDDLCVFFEIDSVLPSDNPDFAFMEKSRFRVKTMKMKGVLSQGLAMPLSILETDKLLNSNKVTEGLDITEIWNITKWEPPIKFNAGDTLGRFPFYVPKTDEIRIQSALGALDELQNALSYATVKCDGTSSTFSHKDEDFQVSSRNLSLKRGEQSIYWKMADKYDLPTKLPKLGNFAVQGEICGPGIQQNRLGLSAVDVFVFDIYDIDAQRYLNFVELLEVTDSLGMHRVPLIKANFVFDLSLEELLESANGRYPISGNLQEGIVVRPMEEMYSETLSGRLSFKALSNEFLLKTGE